MALTREWLVEAIDDQDLRRLLEPAETIIETTTILTEMREEVQLSGLLVEIDQGHQRELVGSHHLRSTAINLQ